MTKQTTQTFDLRTILTVTTDRLLTRCKGPKDNGISDLYKLLGHMTGEDPFIHQLPRFAEECKPYLLQWFPELAIASTKESLEMLDLLRNKAKEEGEEIEEVMDSWVDLLRQTEPNIQDSYEVGQIPADKHDEKPPLDELVDMSRNCEKKPIIGVVEVPYRN